MFSSKSIFRDAFLCSFLFHFSNLSRNKENTVTFIGLCIWVYYSNVNKGIYIVNIYSKKYIDIVNHWILDNFQGCLYGSLNSVGKKTKQRSLMAWIVSLKSLNLSESDWSSTNINEYSQISIISVRHLS